MPRLLDLPNETLLIIIEETSAGDIGSLASCDSNLHCLSQKRLTFHKKKRAEAKKIRLGWAPYVSRWGRKPCASAIHPLKHLQDIFENDDIRFYTKVIEIGYLGPVDPNGSEVVDEKGNRGSPRLEEGRKLIASMKSRYERRITSLVAEVYNALLPHAIKTDLKEWTDKVISGEQEAVVILLLALYPYIDILEIEGTSLVWFDDEKTRESMLYEYRNEAAWKNLFRSLTATAREPGTNKLKIFSKLSKFYLKGEEHQEYFHDNLGPVTPFMALPAMRKITCHDVAGYNVPWPYGIATSNVTSLTLSGNIDKASLRNVISGLKGLKDFWYQITNPESEDDDDYRDRMKWGPHINKDNTANIDPDDYLEEDNDYSDPDEDYSDPDEDYSDPNDKSVEDLGEVVGASLPRWEPRAITEFLLRYACNSLVLLRLGAFSFMRVSNLSDDEPFIPSLRPFRVLTHVHLDTMMLFERVERPKTISVISRNSTQRDFQEAIKAQKLVDFLPSSIEEVYISCEYVGKGLSKRDVEAMFTGLPEQRNRLPKLSKFQVDWMSGWNSSLTRNLEAEREGWEELIKRGEDSEIDIWSNMEECAPSTDAFVEA